jgi:pilus assembly protein CpaB
MEGTMGRRTVLLVAALIVAALGTTMVFLYVNGVNDKAIAKQNPVRVLVAKKLIEPGTSVQDANNAAAFESKTISRDSVVNGAISATTALAGKVATTTIYPGEQIIPQKFGDPGDVSTLVVPAGKLAISVQLYDPAQVAGFVDAGTFVAIFVTAPSPKGGGQDQTRLLLPKVQVLAIGNKTAVPVDPATSGTEQAAVPTTILTVAVDQRDYQRVLFSSTHGRLNLGLLGKDFTPSVAVPPTDQSNLFLTN